MRFTLQLVVLLGLSFGLFMEASARCRRKGGCCKRCPDGWLRFKERCYKFVNEPVTWCEAETACVDAGGNLASLHSEEDAEQVRDIIKAAAGAGVKAWLGGYDQVQEGCWKNSDGSKFDFTHWGEQEPNNWGGNEGCMQMHNEEKQPVNDAPCDVRSAYICAVELEEDDE